MYLGQGIEGNIWNKKERENRIRMKKMKRSLILKLAKVILTTRRVRKVKTQRS